MKRIVTSSIVTLLLAWTTAGPALPQTTVSSPPTQSVPPENASVTLAAKALYSQLLAGKVDRSKMSAVVNDALTDALLQTLSQQLNAAGPPQWQYLKQIASPQGNVFVYRLTYAKATLYMTFGVTAGGTVFDIFFGNQEPAG